MEPFPNKVNITSWFIDQPAERFPSRVAVLGDQLLVRFDELRELTNRAGNALRALGCTVGDRVLIALPDSIEFIAAFFGCAKIGAIPVPVNPLGRADQYTFYLVNSAARGAIVHSSSASPFARALETSRLDRIETVIVGRGHTGTFRKEWSQCLQGTSSELEPWHTTPEDPAFWLYTSGSTGQQKAVVHTHRGMIAANENVGQGLWGITQDDRTLSISRLFFAYGLCSGMYFPLYAGASTILVPSIPAVAKLAEVIGQYRPTIMFALPRIYGAMLDAVERGLRVNLSSVRLAVCSGEPLPLDLFERFQRRFSLDLVDGVGSTEMLTQFISNRPGQVRPGSCGIPVPNCETKLINESGQECRGREVGTLCVKSNTASAGYWDGNALSQPTKESSWLITGDRYYRDAEGFFYYCGRPDDMVKVGGLWVSMRQVEASLCEHPAIAEAAVMCQPNKKGLNGLVAYVVEKKGSTVTREELWRFLSAKIPSHMVPQAIVSIPKLPLTGNGKLDRRALSDPQRPQR